MRPTYDEADYFTAYPYWYKIEIQKGFGGSKNEHY